MSSADLPMEKAAGDAGGGKRTYIRASIGDGEGNGEMHATWELLIASCNSFPTQYEKYISSSENIKHDPVAACLP